MHQGRQSAVGPKAETPPPAQYGPPPRGIYSRRWSSSERVRDALPKHERPLGNDGWMLCIANEITICGLRERG